MTPRSGFVAALAALMTLGATAPGASLPVTIGGRAIIESDGGATFGWPGTYIEGRFHGTAIRVKLDAPTDFLTVSIDGREALRLKRPGPADVRIDKLADGDHLIRLEKLTESQSGGTRFFGFYVAADSVALAAPAPRNRQIEFIGDSYTVGYGNTSSTTTCNESDVHDTTDTQQAFGPLVGRFFDADYRINAYSGFGVVRNYNGGVPSSSLPMIYDRLKPDDASRLQIARGDWQPQVIVINLGTNDFSTPVHPGERWRDLAALRTDYRARYVAFVKGIAERQPQARLILMASPLFLDQVGQVAAMLKADGGPVVTVVPFDGLAYSGCHSHPSAEDDKLLAASLEKAIDRLDVWPNDRSGNEK